MRFFEIMITCKVVLQSTQTNFFCSGKRIVRDGGWGSGGGGVQEAREIFPIVARLWINHLPPLFQSFK